MDSVTQIALGAAVGEKVLGKKVGNKAPLWGAALGILPDLDVLGAAFLSGADQLGFHRWVSHSLLFAVGGGLGIGWALSKLHRDASWREWSALAFWAILTHALLDCFTGYGTQLFSPFSNYPVAFGSIFVIDPLYTLPLAIGLIAALFQRQLHWRRRLNALGLCLSTAYLLATTAICLHVRSTFAHALYPTKASLTSACTSCRPRSTPCCGRAWLARTITCGPDCIPCSTTTRRSASSASSAIPTSSPPSATTRQSSACSGSRAGTIGWSAATTRFTSTDLRFGRSDFYLDSTGTYFFTFRLLPDPSHPERIADLQRINKPIRAHRSIPQAALAPPTRKLNPLNPLSRPIPNSQFLIPNSIAPTPDRRRAGTRQPCPPAHRRPVPPAQTDQIRR